MTLQPFHIFVGLMLICAGVGAASSQEALSPRQATVAKGTIGGPFEPAGTLYDNGRRLGPDSRASQTSNNGTWIARSADDFILDSSCASGIFDISSIRIQMLQNNISAQAFAVDIYADDGSGAAPAPAGSIVPLHTLTQTTQTYVSDFLIGVSVFEARFDTPGLQLDANTRYWISGYGANPALNVDAFDNFFADSQGAPGTTPNGVIIAPGNGIPTWIPALSTGGAPISFSFAIDGACNAPAVPIPAAGNTMLMLAGLMLLLMGAQLLRRRGLD